MSNSLHIGTLAEKSLHASLKAWYTQSGDRLEVSVDNFVIDIVRGDLLIEIQTGNFSALKGKLARLLDHHSVHLVHPISQEKWIVRQTAAGKTLSRRRSPKHGRVVDVFRQLVYLPHLLSHPNLSLEVLLTHEEEILRDDGRGSWRRKRWSLHDRRLLDVVAGTKFSSPADFWAVLPATLPQLFTNADLATALRCRPPLAQKITYTLRRMGGLRLTGKRGKALLYERVFQSDAKVTG